MTPAFRQRLRAVSNSAAPGLLALVLGLAAPAPTSAAEKSPPGGMPDGDIFGFTMPADVGAVGDLGWAAEYTGRFGKGGGTFGLSGLQASIGTTFAPQWSATIAAVVSHHYADKAPQLPNDNDVGFQGGSVEITRELLPRGSSPVAVSLSVEAGGSVNDDATGRLAPGVRIESKLLMDATLIPDRLFAAINLKYAIGAQEAGPRQVLSPSSETIATLALTTPLTSWLLAGVELRHAASYRGGFLNHRSAWALYAGPTLAIKFGEGSVFNVAWLPQVHGGDTDDSRRLSLTGYERHMVRVKFATSF